MLAGCILFRQASRKIIIKIYQDLLLRLSLHVLKLTDANFASIYVCVNTLGNMQNSDLDS